MLTRDVVQGAGIGAHKAVDGCDATSRFRVLLVEGDCPYASTCTQALAPHGIDSVVVDCLASARRLLREPGMGIQAVLIALHLPDGRGEELLPDIEALSNQPGVVLFSNCLEQIRPEATLYRTVLVTKSIAPAALARILRLAASGYASSTIKRFARYFRLTPRESEILVRLAAGTAPKEIARACGCSIQAVYAHLSRVGRKVHATGHYQIVAKLFQFSCHSLGRPPVATP
jgi:DNA-binding CsgD family transcriptional regulator